MKVKIGSKVTWQWLGRPVHGIVKKVFFAPVVMVIKGKSIKRNGSKDKPAYLVESEAGNLALKLSTEISMRASSKRKKETPSLFS